MEESWELDALDPNTIVNLVDGAIRGIVDFDKWVERHNLQERHRDQLSKASARWDELTDILEN